jgi:hypothetical protein
MRKLKIIQKHFSNIKTNLAYILNYVIKIEFIFK